MSTVGNLAPQKPVPKADQVKKYIFDTAILGPTRRFKQLDRYEAVYWGRQYSHQTYDWWGMSADQMETVSPDVMVPYGWTQPALDAINVRMKRPTAPYNMCRGIVDRFTGLLFSEIRKPKLVWEDDPETEDFMHCVIDQTNFWSKMTQARQTGGVLGSVLMTVHLRNGDFNIEIHNPKHCQIVWKDKRTHTPLAVLKSYIYQVEEAYYDPKTGDFQGTRPVDYLYRRIITEEDDTVYEAVKFDPKEKPTWKVESEAKHNLGFFPGVWIQNLPKLDEPDGDGDPDCSGVWQNFDTIDRLLSQMNKGTLLNCDPTLILGIDPKTQAMGGGLQKGSEHAISVGPDGKAEYLEISGSSVDAPLELLKVLKQQTLDITRCVIADPNNIAGSAQSARAIEFLYQPMIEKADVLRAHYGDMGIRPLLELMEKMARHFEGKTFKDADGETVKFGFNFKKEVKLGPGGHLLIQWGPYFAPTEEDKQLRITNAIAAKAGGLIDLETAMNYIADIFQVRDVASMMKKVEKESEDELDAMYDQATKASGLGLSNQIPGAKNTKQDNAKKTNQASKEDKQANAGRGGKA